jgi:hypothetical protein
MKTAKHDLPEEKNGHKSRPHLLEERANENAGVIEMPGGSLDMHPSAMYPALLVNTPQPAADEFSPVLMRQPAMDATLRILKHPTAGRFRDAAALQMQQSLGNAGFQRLIEHRATGSLFILQRSPQPTPWVVQRSPLSDELAGIWLEQDRDAFFERLRALDQSDMDVLALVNETLQGNDWALARSILGAPLTREEVDAIVRERIESELERFQRIPIEVTGTAPVSTEEGTSEAEPVTVRVEVEAAYFINTATAQTHYANARQAADFRAIIRALQPLGRISLIEGAGGGRTVGRSVELGKATPDEVRLFIEEALAQGSIQRYAVQTGSLLPDQQLIELTANDLRTVIESWINYTGVGVDCSGFVLQAAIRARQEVRATMAATGTPTEQLPAEIGRAERRAASFLSGPRVTSPADLRPGDAWVVSGGQHVRILSDVRTVTLEDGSETIEFETAESSGGSTQPAPGPIGRTWRTRSTTIFNPITRVDSTGTAIGGAFHRIP